MPPIITSLDAELSDTESARSAQTPRSSTPKFNMSRKKAREMRLRSDKFADVQGPGLVRCLNCGTSITLSKKSEYDAWHWLRHRTSCLKRTKKRGRRMQSTSSAESSPVSSARALTPNEEDDETQHSEIASVGSPLDRAPALQPDIPVSYDWQSWDWSQVKSRFPGPDHLF
ncbi:hypothetical protein B0H11DRAFT_2221712 [Mycena galericulata]|nr:hypothetical protein B0H11DRAFT_2221712 [Mycena galericulata]